MALASWALLTLEDAKAYLGLSGTTAEDGAVSDLIETASSLCEDETDRLLKSRTYTDEVYDGSGGCALRMRQYPVTVVTAVSFWNGTGWELQDQTALGLFVAGPLADRLALRSGLFPRGWQMVKVSYTAGLTIDAKLRQACREILMSLYRQRDKQQAGIASQSFGGQTVTFTSEDIPKQARTLLARYQRMTA